MKLPLLSHTARQQPPPPRPPPHRYRKGMIMVGVLLISESYTVVNAISFWNQFKLIPQPRHPHQQQHPQQQQQQPGFSASSFSTTNTVGRSSSSTSSRHSHGDECLPPPPTFLYALLQLFTFPQSSSSSSTTTTTTTTATTTTTTKTSKKKNKKEEGKTLSTATTPLQKIAAWRRGGALEINVPDTITTTTPYQMPLYFWKLVFQSVLTLINVICWYVPLQLHARQQRKAQQPMVVTTTSTTTSSTSTTATDDHSNDHVRTGSSTGTPTTTTTPATAATTTTDVSLQHPNNNNNNDITEANQFYMSIANAFSGGVFLSLAFGHLIPECVHGFAADHHGDPTQPYWFVLTGYLLIFVVEKVAFSESHELLSHHHHHSPPPPPALHSNHPTDDDDDDSKNNEPPPISSMNGGSAVSSSSSVLSPPPTSTSTPALATGRSALILLAALGVHSVLEMMALGLADTFRDCALLTISISLHQPAESIALLVAFIKSGLTHTQIIVFLSIFSSMGMIGVLLGMMVNEYAAPIVDSIMLAIVAGTFVYVGATEIIPEEFESSQYKWKKFLAFLSGIVTILCITQYTATLGGH